MGQVLQELERSISFLTLVRSRIETCFLCKWIDTDLAMHDKLTGWPLDSFGKPDFPIDAKLIHVVLELGEIPPDDPESAEDVASVVAHLLEV